MKIRSSKGRNIFTLFGSSETEEVKAGKIVDDFKLGTKDFVSKDEMGELIKRYLNCKANCYFADIDNPEIVFY
ncbi:MAG TPA: hypothetical protein GXZ31_05770 [Thermoanaerobacterales bacterium]|nr:hypothetical protein [Thermoanaerobacterales bacterium]